MHKRVEFEEPDRGSLLYGHFEKGTEPPGMVKFVMKTGIVKTPGQANVVLIAFIVVALAFTGYQISNLLDETQPGKQPVYREDLPPEIRNKLSDQDLMLIPSRNE